MPTNWADALQEAVYNRLASYTPLTVVIDGIYDHVDQDDADFPYVTIGEAVIAENNTDSNLGVIATQTIHVWSDQPQRTETKQIQSLIAEALARYDLPISGFTLITCELESESSFLDADGVTRHGQSTFTIQFE